MTVSPYDNARGAFSHSCQPTASVFATLPPAQPVAVHTNWSFPTTVFIDRANAAAFLHKLETKDRSAFLGLQVSLVDPEWDGQFDRARLELVLERAALYADPDLRTEMHQFSLWTTD